MSAINQRHPVTDEVVGERNDVVIRASRSSRTAGRWMIGIGILGMVVAIIGGVIGWQLVDRMSNVAATSLVVTDDALDTVQDTVALADATVDALDSGLVTLTAAVGGAEASLDAIADVLDESLVTIGTEVPASIGAIRAAFPAVISSAELLNDTLGALAFLGIDFRPETPFAESLGRIDDSLADLGADLQQQAPGLARIAADFRTFGDDTATLATDLEELSGQVSAATVLFDEYAGTLGDANELIARAQADVDGQRSALRLLIVLVSVAVALGQFAPIYIGRRLTQT